MGIELVRNGLVFAANDLNLAGRFIVRLFFTSKLGQLLLKKQLT